MNEYIESISKGFAENLTYEELKEELTKLNSELKKYKNHLFSKKENIIKEDIQAIKKAIKMKQKTLPDSYKNTNLSHGTLRTEDLIESFFPFIKENRYLYNKENKKKISKLTKEIKLLKFEDDNRYSQLW